jgi:ADP-ribose pyrophosphatase YjhB (NUDIX family)
VIGISSLRINKKKRLIMEISAGLLIIWENKILLAKPAKAVKNMWGIPKGKLEPGESYLDAAIRETQEEIGIKIPLSKISSEYFTINYKNNILHHKD